MSNESDNCGIRGMKEGYNENSLLQLAAIQLSAPSIREGVDALNVDKNSLMMIADYGSSHGSNSVHAMQYFIQKLKETNKFDEKNQQILVIHNDLPTNEWSSVFDVLNKNKSYFGLASGRSFYERCLPSNLVSVAYSSLSIHWLSRKPCNLTDQCIVDYSRHDQETNAFRKQAADDYAAFLEHRSNELLPGGVLVLGILSDSFGEDTREHGHILYRCAQSLLTPEELLDYTIPFYLRSYTECVNDQLFKKYHLELIKGDTFQVKSPQSQQWKDGQITLDEFARTEVLAFRSVLEHSLRQVLTNNKQRTPEQVEQILNQYWALNELEVKKQPDLYYSDFVVINLVLRKFKK